MPTTTTTTSSTSTSTTTSGPCVEPTLIENGDFESGNQYPFGNIYANSTTSLAHDTTQQPCHSGQYCLLQSATVEYADTIVRFNTVPGHTYTITGYSRPGNAANMACTVEYTINLDNTGPGYRTLARLALYTDTTTYIKTTAADFVATTETSMLFLETRCVKGTSAAIYFDDITVVSNPPFCTSVP